MRISDWSSDVCSSELPEILGRDALDEIAMGRLVFGPHRAQQHGFPAAQGHGLFQRLRIGSDGQPVMADDAACRDHPAGDPKSVVEGKSVSVRVNPGACRSSKQNNTTNDKTQPN